MGNRKLNVYKKVLQKVCEKFNGAEEYIKERIEALYSYLFFCVMFTLDAELRSKGCNFKD